MEYLYVCQFSNGLIKVGRSIDPTARIATHADRVSCMGVELVRHEIFVCNDDVDRAERSLIEDCSNQATERHLNEWFGGLNFHNVCRAAREISARTVRDRELPTRWSRILADLKNSGVTHAQVARECEVGPATISRLALGQQAEPMYSVGERLLQLHADLKQSA